MSQHAVIRHPETGGVGTSPADAMDHHRARGWVRVSEYRSNPADFDLSAFAGAPDLDAEPEQPDLEPTTDAPAKPPAKNTKRSQA